MIQLVVNDIELDLFPDTTVGLSKRAANIGNFNGRAGSFTNKFSVPLTSKNKAALGFLQANTTSRTVYEDVNGKLVSDGIEIVSNVRIVIEQVSDVAELQLKVDTGNLFDLLKKTKLRSISLRDYDHRWNQAAIVAAKDNVWTDAYTYPIFQNGGQLSAFQTVNCKGLIPWVYVKFLLNRIANQFGYNFVGSGYTDPLLEKLVLPIGSANNDKLIMNDYLVRSNVVTRTGWQITSTGGVTIDGGNVQEVAQCAIENLTPLTTDLYDIINEGQGLTWNGSPVGGFDLLLPGTYKFKITYSFTLYDRIGSDWFGGILIFRRLNGFTQIIFKDQQDTEGTFTGEVFLDVSKDNGIDDNFTNSDTYVYAAGFSGNVFDDPFTGSVTVDYSIQVELVECNLPTTFYNRPITLSPNLPDWDCGKFFKEVANLNGSSFQVDEYSREIRMFKLNELETNKANPYDWSDKLTIDNAAQFRFELSGLGKETLFSYDKFDIYSYLLIISNTQLPENEDYVKSSFVPIEQENAMQLENIAFFDIWDDDNNRNVFDGKPRIGLIRTTTGTTYSSPNQSAITPSGTDNVGYFDDVNNFSLDWAVLYLEYYSQVLDNLAPDILVIDAEFLLNCLDIQNFDFSVPVYLSQYGAYYFVNEIKEFTTPNDVTSVTLVRI
jgi:hypothetical protein